MIEIEGKQYVEWASFKTALIERDGARYENDLLTEALNQLSSAKKALEEKRELAEKDFGAASAEVSRLSKELAELRNQKEAEYSPSATAWAEIFHAVAGQDGYPSGIVSFKTTSDYVVNHFNNVLPELLKEKTELSDELEQAKQAIVGLKIEKAKLTHQLHDLEAKFNRPQDFRGLRSISSLQTAIHQTAKEHGWWEPQEIIPESSPSSIHNFGVLMHRTFGDLLALVHSEISEALEAFRDRGLKTWYVHEKDCASELAEDAQSCYCVEGPKPEGAFVELADAIIRILDIAGHYEVDMQALILEKMAYNETREFRHGNKKL